MTLRGALGLAGLLAIAGLVYARGLDAAANYDEGVYLASLDALRHGQELGTDVYASQPPGFYVLLQALSLLPGDGVGAIRVAFLLVGLGGLVAAYFIGRRMAGGWGGMGASALLALTAPYPVQAARVQADTPCVALSLAAIAVAFYAKRCPWRWAGVGVLAGSAIAVKFLALPVVAPIAVLLFARRSWQAAWACIAGAAVVWAALLISYAGALGELWESVVSDHRDARGLGPAFWDNAERVFLHPLDRRTAAALLVLFGLLAAIGLLRGLELLALGLWTGTTVVFLLAQQPLLDHHFVLLTATLAVPAGAGLGAYVVYTPRMRKGAVVAFAVILLTLAAIQELDRLGDQDGDTPGVTWAADQLRARTSPEDLVGTDLPIVAYLADRRLPGQLVDTSFVRLGTGSLTDDEILDELEGVRAVVVGREFANRPALIRELAARYPQRSSRNGVTIYRAP
jgi:4-amino-4-deoxy-L-arabinose transferase-like glycosyltransferase